MLIDLSDRAKFRATGPDCKRFLNGQLTNNMLALQPGFAIYACALTAKGRLCADLFAAAAPEGNYYLDADSLLRESLSARLEKYLIADDVTLEDVTNDYGLFHFVEHQTPAGGRRNLESLDISADRGCFLIESNRYGINGTDLWFPASEAAAIKDLLKLSPVDSATAENLRIEQGIARWGYELSENVLPQEAGLDDRAISYTKGCYLGQEVISRIKSIGHVNRHLRGLVPERDVTIETADKLFLSEEKEKEIGIVTSVGRSRAGGGTIALGYVRRGFDNDGTTLQVHRNKILIGPVKIRRLPFESA